MNLLAIQRFYQSADLGSWQHQLDGKRPSHRFEEIRQLRGHKDGTPTNRQLGVRIAVNSARAHRLEFL